MRDPLSADPRLLDHAHLGRCPVFVTEPAGLPQSAPDHEAGFITCKGARAEIENGQRDPMYARLVKTRPSAS